MTTSENVGKAYMLSEVEKQIRKDIPRLMELREGCKFHSGYGVETIVCIKGDKEDIFIFKDLFSNIYETNEIPQHYKIIGHNIMLNDVLEWIKFNAFSVEFQENGDFNLHRELKLSKSIERYNFVNWDLSKPLLKDQSEELIKFLYNITKNE